MNTPESTQIPDLGGSSQGQSGTPSKKAKVKPTIKTNTTIGLDTVVSRLENFIKDDVNLQLRHPSSKFVISTTLRPQFANNKMTLFTFGDLRKCLDIAEEGVMPWTKTREGEYEYGKRKDNQAANMAVAYWFHHRSVDDIELERFLAGCLRDMKEWDGNKTLECKKIKDRCSGIKSYMLGFLKAWVIDTVVDKSANFKEAVVLTPTKRIGWFAKRLKKQGRTTLIAWLHRLKDILDLAWIFQVNPVNSSADDSKKRKNIQDFFVWFFAYMAEATWQFSVDIGQFDTIGFADNFVRSQWLHSYNDPSLAKFSPASVDDWPVRREW